MATVFFSYSHEDEALRDQLEVQLSMLKRQGIVETWHDRRIGAGEDIDHSISGNIEAADIILLLVSSDFLASNYCYDREMQRAMARHAAGEAIVIPVILRACDWHPAPFGKLNATPPDGKPVMQAIDRDQAFLEVAKAIRVAAASLDGGTRVASAPKQSEPWIVIQPAPGGRVTAAPDGPRSSNLRLAKSFNDRDKDAFQHDTFEFIARYFENSLNELVRRNAGVEGTFRRIDANRFTAAAYLNGKKVARCIVFIGGSRGFMQGIGYSASETSESNSYNGLLSVESDEQSLYLSSMGFGFSGQGRDQKLSREGGAEHFWDMFISPLQQ